ncbi:type II secretion system protein [Salicola sp. Rm-C-2C1-2]|uniref:type II secretion system protein n=1 Tax=Salicola sp. Rm-C-2C1-2 TaxID=3141321 RepID=UPI0032E41E35
MKRCTIRLDDSGGFTLVELVITLVLIGILSSLGIGLFANRSGFSPLLANQQLASAVRLAQQGALAGNPADDVAVAQVGDEFEFTVGGGTSAERVFSLPRESASLSTTPTITFQPDGTPASGANTELTFSGSGTSYTTCISSLGAVYQGGCQP